MNQLIDENDALAEMEEQLFGIARPRRAHELKISDNDFVPLKTGIPGHKLLKYGPKHILNADQFEPLYIHQEYILEDCLRREAERVAHQENLMNRVVYDSLSQNAEEKKDGVLNDTQNPMYLPTLSNCDNDSQMESYYKSTSKNDFTLCFESRFESGNLRRAIQVYEFEYDLILKPDYLTKVNN